MMLLQIFVSHLIWKPPPAWLAHSSPDELLLGKSEGPPRKNRGHNQEQTFSIGRSDVLKHLSSSQKLWSTTLAGCGVCANTAFQTFLVSESFAFSPFSDFLPPLLSIFRKPPSDSRLSLFCPCRQCSADRWFSLLQTNYLAPEQRGWLVTTKKTPTKTLNLNIGG